MDRKETIESLQQKVLLRRKKIDKLHKEIEDLKLQMIPLCDHLNTSDYTWTHSNGYGRHSQMKGKQCIFCNKIDLWNNNHFVEPKDIVSRWDDD